MAPGWRSLIGNPKLARSDAGISRVLARVGSDARRWPEPVLSSSSVKVCSDGLSSLRTKPAHLYFDIEPLIIYFCHDSSLCLLTDDKSKANSGLHMIFFLSSTVITSSYTHLHNFSPPQRNSLSQVTFHSLILQAIPINTSFQISNLLKSLSSILQLLPLWSNISGYYYQCIMQFTDFPPVVSISWSFIMVDWVHKSFCYVFKTCIYN